MIYKCTTNIETVYFPYICIFSIYPLLTFNLFSDPVFLSLLARALSLLSPFHFSHSLLHSSPFLPGFRLLHHPLLSLLPLLVPLHLPSPVSPSPTPSPISLSFTFPRSSISPCAPSATMPSHPSVCSSSCSTLCIIFRAVDSSSAISRASLVCRVSRMTSKRFTLSSVFSTSPSPSSVSSSIPIFVRIWRPFSSNRRLAAGYSRSVSVRSSFDRLKRSE